METLNYVSMYNPKNATLIKRLAAFLLDAILLAVLFVGVMLLFSVIFNYDDLNNKLNAFYIDSGAYVLNEEGNYEFGTTSEAIEAYNNLIKNEEFIEVYNDVVNYLIYAPIGAMFLSLLVFELIIPLIFKNGQTIGFKCLNIALLSDKDIKVKPVQVFIRFLFGKFIFVGVIPVLGIMFIFFSNNQFTGWVLILADLIINLILYVTNVHHALIPDVIARCFPVDAREQMFFDTLEDLNLAKGKEANMYEKAHRK